ncbi:MAG: hypothetical protein V9F00_02495, partial [Nocardioides sp.]
MRKTSPSMRSRAARPAEGAVEGAVGSRTALRKLPIAAAAEGACGAVGAVASSRSSTDIDAPPAAGADGAAAGGRAGGLRDAELGAQRGGELAVADELDHAGDGLLGGRALRRVGVGERRGEG